jgi:radical SAM protein with 4Fe4S-binding SPASM domain
VEDEGFPEPALSKHGPELLDISITNRCAKECSICYKGSTALGTEMSLKDYAFIIEQAAKIGVYQVALGGGNPNEHKFFNNILQITRAQYGIVPSYSTNGSGLTSQVLRATAEFCGAVAVSAYEPYGNLVTSLGLLKSYGVTTSIHFTVSKVNVYTIIDWLRNGHEAFALADNIVFLNFKPVGRGGDSRHLLSDDDLLGFFSAIDGYQGDCRMGFDSCFIAAVCRNMNIDTRFYDACEGGRFSAYISEDLKLFPCSFFPLQQAVADLRTTTLIEGWQRLLSQQEIHNVPQLCDICRYFTLCKGGCLLLPEINYCNVGER